MLAVSPHVILAVGLFPVSEKEIRDLDAMYEGLVMQYCNSFRLISFDQFVRLRRNRMRILMGDRVDVELSPYDLTKGRITYRHK